MAVRKKSRNTAPKKRIAARKKTARKRASPRRTAAKKSAKKKTAKKKVTGKKAAKRKVAAKRKPIRASAPAPSHVDPLRASARSFAARLLR